MRAVSGLVDHGTDLEEPIHRDCHPDDADGGKEPIRHGDDPSICWQFVLESEIQWIQQGTDIDENKEKEGVEL